jgi:hypothetical protein
MTGWRISIASQAKGSDTERTVFHHGQESDTPIEAAYIGADHSVTFTFFACNTAADHTLAYLRNFGACHVSGRKRRVVEFVFEVHSDGSSTTDCATESSHAT